MMDYKIKRDNNINSTQPLRHPGEILRVLSPFSYIVGMQNGSHRHLQANRMQKLITDVCHVAIVREQDTDFGENSSVPVDDTLILPSKMVTNIDHLTSDQQTKLTRLLDKFADCFFKQARVVYCNAT